MLWSIFMGPKLRHREDVETAKVLSGAEDVASESRRVPSASRHLSAVVSGSYLATSKRPGLMQFLINNTVG
jgi:hypothetical protein